MSTDRAKIDLANFKAALTRSSRTQRALAADLGLGEVELSARVRGARPLTLDLVERIAVRLGVPAESLLASAPEIDARRDGDAA